jgi:hypothetical protein
LTLKSINSGEENSQNTGIDKDDEGIFSDMKDRTGKSPFTPFDSSPLVKSQTINISDEKKKGHYDIKKSPFGN